MSGPRRGEHWPSRRAAEFLLTHFGDREAATAALGRSEANLRSPSPHRLLDELEQLLVWLVEITPPETGYSWALLALILTLARRAPGDGFLHRQQEERVQKKTDPRSWEGAHRAARLIRRAGRSPTVYDVHPGRVPE